MKKFLFKRILVMIPVFFGMTILVFLLSNLTPGSPVDAMITPEMTPADIEALYVRMGLDQPLHIQYIKWLGRLFQGSLGYSYRTGTEVIRVIGERVGPTLLLTGVALALSILIGVVLGVLAACKPYSLWDYLASGLSFIGAGVPTFFLALISIYLLSVRLKWLPTGGMYTNANVRDWLDVAKHLLQPAVVLAITMTGSYIRQTRSAMLEVLGEEYIKMARAKGLREKAVLYSHALRNAMMPIATQIGMSVPFLVGGAVVTEQIFGWPGMGSLMVLSITYRDYPVIMGVTVYITFAVMAVNLLMDIVYALLDPRVRN